MNFEKWRKRNFADGDPTFDPKVEFQATIFSLSIIMAIILKQLIDFYPVLLFNLWEILQ
ncbi:hypothetical protein SPONL_1650 [uncultured Candidatus Thioglobus sp.]|nr:hypothetical protein SPONL_1650 [uncultured Candidatus Thioglobus sp.]